MQIMAKHDQLCELAEEHEMVLRDALMDGVITVQEQCDILQSARALKRATARQALRVKLGVRMIRGGHMDREIGQDIADYTRLLNEEAAERYSVQAA